MVVSLDLTGARAAEFSAGTSPLAELLACLHVLAEPEHHPEARAWVTQVRAGLSATLGTQLTALSPLWARYRMRTLFPLTVPLNRTFAEELADLATLDRDTFVDSAAIAIRGTIPESRPVVGDPGTHGAFIEACDRRSFARGELARRLLDDWAALRADLTEALGNCWDAFFADEWQRIGPHLGDVAVKVSAQLRKESASVVLASLSPTAVATAGSVRYDKLQVASATVHGRGALLIPTVHGWPHLILKIDEPDHPIVVHFLSSDWEQHVPLSQSLIRERLAALVEPGRWELVRHLVNEPITTSELARRTGLTAPQVSRHLRRLRTVGLITSQREGRMVHHRLHAVLLLDLGRDALTALMR